ncbi:MAG: hypothetical protein IPO83_10830 [Chitinophagaceae bacterium]|nr:hypothetical protein [Chitinophagaceae bacterium]
MNKTEELLHELKEYIALRIRIGQLIFSNKSSIVASSLITYMIIFMLAFFFILVLTIGLSLWISTLFGKWFIGFLIMAGIYLFLGVIIYSFRNKWIRQPMNDLIVKEIFDED